MQAAKDIAKNGEDTSEGFIFPSYVEDILGPELFVNGMDHSDGAAYPENRKI